MKPKVLVILGPTAVGKSDLAVEVARMYNGEVISADSRQVYTGLDIGTGKITKKEMRGVPHHLLDVMNPKRVFSVELWKKHTEKALEDIISRGKLPIICGGTGFYIQSIVDNITLPDVPANKKLRKELSLKTADELFLTLKKLDAKRAKNIDAKNPVRLIRAIEIATVLGNIPNAKKVKSDYEFIQIGLTLPLDTLRSKIHARLLSRVKKGMLAEAKKLHEQRLSYKRMEALGLEYRYLALYLQKKITKEEMLERLTLEIGQYARRQIQWFKRDKRIKWFDAGNTLDTKEHIKQSLF
ncbi:MAG: tRNA delta(2)-isopentenylpyrophosphate transferase, tRNA dimethylallyltransferase [Candidatus Parcubacteria bacterium]|jgi:tRNA dimethylallyltransferase